MIFFKWLGKLLISGILAMAVLTAFCFFYYNAPVRSTTIDGVTDYSWEYNKFYSRGTEGFALGKTNNEGYLNLFDYKQDMPLDILIIGSSHMEAYNVDMSKSTSAQLNKKMAGNYVYNIAVSGHFFITCISNLNLAIEKYRPTKYVVIETSSLIFDDTEIQKFIDNKVEELPSYDFGIIGILQRNPFLRLTYTQITSFLEQNIKKSTNDNITNNNLINEELYDLMMKKISDIANSNGIKIIILHHNNLTINEDDSVSPKINSDVRKTFGEICKDNGILFLDMTETFINAYDTKHILPHGFSNTTIGSGHLNENGHNMIAEELYKLIVQEGE